jgi:putative FmdB family regulatory protein
LTEFLLSILISICFVVGNWKIVWKILFQQREEGEEMPSYGYRCPKCNKKFTLILSIGEHDAGKAKCPKCGARELEQFITAFQVKTSRKS